MIRTKELIDHYQRYFYTVKANTTDLKNLAFQLRYQVYVEECGYNFGGDFQNKTERDDYDNYALHSLLFHKPSRRPIGHIRLIPFKKENNKLLPIEQFCENSFDRKLISIDQLRTVKTGEISRMALISSFRRRPYDTSIQGSEVIEDAEDHNRRFRVNYLPMCLILASINLMFETKIEYSLALMDQRLELLLKRYGVQYKQIGQSIEHAGIRAPYIMYGQRTYDNLHQEYRELYNIIQHELKFGAEF